MSYAIVGEDELLKRFIVAILVTASLTLIADTQKMIEDINELARLTERYTNISEFDKDVMKTIEKIDRSKFVPDFSKARRISQPAAPNRTWSNNFTTVYRRADDAFA